jgi:hypothetical protein
VHVSEPLGEHVAPSMMAPDGARPDSKDGCSYGATVGRIEDAKRLSLNKNVHRPGWNRWSANHWSARVREAIRRLLIAGAAGVLRATSVRRPPGCWCNQSLRTLDVERRIEQALLQGNAAPYSEDDN